jgi:hypothetical protein
MPLGTILELNLCGASFVLYTGKNFTQQVYGAKFTPFQMAKAFKWAEKNGYVILGAASNRATGKPMFWLGCE